MINRSVTADSLSQSLLANTVRMDFAAGSTGAFQDWSRSRGEE